MAKIIPEIDHQLLGINDDCLLVQNYYAAHNVIMGWGGVWLFWLIGLPGFISFVIAPWLPPYGYRNGIEIISFYEKISGLPLSAFIAYFLFYVIMLGGTSVAITLGFGYLLLRTASKNLSLIAFNRKTQTVSTLVKGEILTVPWHELRTEGKGKTLVSGYVPHRVKLVFIKNFGDFTAIDGTHGSADNNATDTEVLWEYIRVFMTQGPQSLNVSTTGYLGINNLDKQPLFSYDFATSLKSNWPWPIIKDKNRNPVMLFVQVAVVWPFRVVAFIPNMLTDWLWRKMCLRKLKDSKAVPHYHLAQYPDMITPKDVEKVITVEEASRLKGIPYPEAQKRLDGLL